MKNEIQRFLCLSRHVNYQETGNKGFVQFLCPSISVVHGSDKSGCRMKFDPVIARNINGTAVIKSRMKYGYRVIFRHIDLVQDSEAAIFRTLINTSFAKLYLIVDKCICSDQITAVGIYMKGYIIRRSAENIGKIFCQDIFSCCLRTCQKQIFAPEKACNSHLQDILSIKGD